MKKILFYTNQFFGQIGGEDMAYAEPQLFEGMHGSANTFGAPLKDIAEIVATIVCGDNFYAENMETGRAFLLEQIKKYQPDLIIAGPAFNAGRFGIACGDVCKTAKEQAGVEAITGLYEENPAVDMFKKDVYILRVAKSAAGIRKAVPLMAGFARKLLTGEPIGTPEDEQYYAKGKRVNIFREKNGAERAVDMLLAKVKGEPYKTELEISTYEKVEPLCPHCRPQQGQDRPLHHRRHGPHGQPRPHGGGYRQVLEGVPRGGRHAGERQVGVRPRRLRPCVRQQRPQPGRPL